VPDPAAAGATATAGGGAVPPVVIPLAGTGSGNEDFLAKQGAPLPDVSVEGFFLHSRGSPCAPWYTMSLIPFDRRAMRAMRASSHFARAAMPHDSMQRNWLAGVAGAGAAAAAAAAALPAKPFESRHRCRYNDIAVEDESEWSVEKAQPGYQHGGSLWTRLIPIEAPHQRNQLGNSRASSLYRRWQQKTYTTSS
jgi:hypothetical protein